MKTHDLAKALSILSKILLSGPDSELSEWTGSQSARTAKKERKETATDFSYFLSFATFTKSQWLELIKEYDIPITIPSDDSARNIMGKIVKYYNSNPEARKNLFEKASKQSPKPSSELLNALSVLLKVS